MFRCDTVMGMNILFLLFWVVNCLHIPNSTQAHLSFYMCLHTIHMFSHCHYIKYFICVNISNCDVFPRRKTRTTFLITTITCRQQENNIHNGRIMDIYIRIYDTKKQSPTGYCITYDTILNDGLMLQWNTAQILTVNSILTT